MAGRKKIVWSEKARNDLLTILDFYFKRNGNATYSRKIYIRIKKDLSLLSAHTFLGKPTDHEGIRVIVVMDYQVFYQLLPDSLFIINIWDSRRNPDDLKT